MGPCARDATECANFVRTRQPRLFVCSPILLMQSMCTSVDVRHDGVTAETCGLTLLPFVVGRTRNQLCIRFRGHMLGWANPNPDLPVTGFKIVLLSKSPCVSCTHWAWCHSTHYCVPNPCKGLGFGSGLQPPVCLGAVCSASR